MRGIYRPPNPSLRSGESPSGMSGIFKPDRLSFENNQSRFDSRCVRQWWRIAFNNVDNLMSSQTKDDVSSAYQNEVVTAPDMLDLAKHIVNQKPATFDPAKFEDHYESALTELINQKRSGKPITAKARPKGENVVDLMEALKRSIGNEAQATKGKKPRKAAAGQKEMLLPISGKRAAKQDAKKADKPAAARTRKRA